ncbi:hypothetical protein [Chryseolinea lacunae]|uniref:Uncharacterized protein n=1 Tax=Chryseolinea lacunae TaxID=2801331 RepID=A0ABS1KZN1_9BACT|nr:hypothetical protein [Chryseolinea lacunae]MBL0744628.1 hypothetical protein [Chryseolinea lacunae]
MRLAVNTSQGLVCLAHIARPTTIEKRLHHPAVRLYFISGHTLAPFVTPDYSAYLEARLLSTEKVYENSRL